jgi:hypothetical protein
MSAAVTARGVSRSGGFETAVSGAKLVENMGDQRG